MSAIGAVTDIVDKVVFKTCATIYTYLINHRQRITKGK